MISQFIETSYAYGFKTNIIEKNEDVWELEISTDKEQEKEKLTQYCSIISKFWGCYKMTIPCWQFAPLK